MEQSVRRKTLLVGTILLATATILILLEGSASWFGIITILGTVMSAYGWGKNTSSRSNPE
jgi:membrane-bound ClpP family serine protease